MLYDTATVSIVTVAMDAGFQGSRLKREILTSEVASIKSRMEEAAPVKTGTQYLSNQGLAVKL